MFDWTATSAIALGCASVVVLYIGQHTFRSRTAHPLPPGPPGLPWVGNVIGIDTSAPWSTYAKWAKTYGDLIYTRLCGRDIIIINSEKIAKDLLENRSKIYSDRPNLIISAMWGLSYNSILMPYGDRWRQHRRFFHLTYRPEAVPRFLPYLHQKACNLLQQLLDTPEQLSDHVFKYTSAVVLNSTYDYDPALAGDELVDIAANVIEIVVPALRLDVAVIAGAFPWLLRLPSWLPGMSFKKGMEVAHAYSRQYLERPFQYSLAKSSSVAPSMVHDALRLAEENEISPDESWMEALKEASGTAFLAASETSNSVLMTFFLMMVVNPEVQERAQSQIDAVVGRDRLPTMEDRPLLPLIDAIFQETIRYSPPAPFLIPHATVDDDSYCGFHIPKGAIILANVWSMAHDESRYPNAHAFKPERFLNDDGSLKPSAEYIAYGFGRRICPGRYFADVSVWAVIAKVLAVFKILKPLNEHGREIHVEPRFSTGLSVRPLPFGYRIVPRVPGLDAEELEQLIATSTH